MLDINTFIRMTRIVPSGFVAGEDYTFFLMTPSAVVEKLIKQFSRVLKPSNAAPLYQFTTA